VQREGRAVVYVIRDDRAVEVPVTPGTKGGDLTASTGDVKAGEKAVQKPAAAIVDGALVKVAQK